MSSRKTNTKGTTDGARWRRAGRYRRGYGRCLAIGWSVWSVLGLGTFLAERGNAQEQRLSIRPHEIKGAERTGPAGDIPLDSLPGYSLYAPQSCTGKPRCPLVVVASDLPKMPYMMPQTALGWLRPVADKYGLIMLVLDPYRPVRMDSAASRERIRGEDVSIDPRRLDAALTQVFQKVAVDPDRLAFLGYVPFPWLAFPKMVRDVWPLAVQNLGVFNRVVISATVAKELSLTAPPAAPARPARFLLAGKVPGDEGPIAFRFADSLRRQGHPTTLLLSLRLEDRGMWEELDFIGRWLRDSWGTPDAAARPSAGAEAGDSLPQLTVEAIDRLAQFWTNFQQEPDSIRRLGRRAHLRDVTLPIGTGVARPLTRLTDMAALARRYPSVAAKLQAAGMTAAEHDAYRLALVGARVVRQFGDSATALVVANSVVAQNAAFLKADNEADRKMRFSKGLVMAQDRWEVSGMWQTP